MAVMPCSGYEYGNSSQTGYHIIYMSINFCGVKIFVDCVCLLLMKNYYILYTCHKNRSTKSSELPNHENLTLEINYSYAILHSLLHHLFVEQNTSPPAASDHRELHPGYLLCSFFSSFFSTLYFIFISSKYVSSSVGRPSLS